MSYHHHQGHYGGGNHRSNGNRSQWDPQQGDYSSNYEYELPEQHFQPHHRGQHPGSHADSAYSRARNERQHDDEYQSYSQAQRSHPAALAVGRSQTLQTDSTVSRGADNLGPMSAGGGMAGIAASIAGSHERQSGLNAMRQGPDQGYYSHHLSDNAPFYAADNHVGADSMSPGSFTSNAPLDGHGPYSPGRSTPSDHGYNNGQQYYEGLHATYNDPYHRQRTSWTPMNEPINPHDIADDGDDGFMPEPKRRSVLAGLGRNQNPSHQHLTGGDAAVAGAALGGGAAAVASRSVGPTGGSSRSPDEKSEWLVEQKSSKKRLKWAVIALLIVLVIGGVAGGVVGGIVLKKDSNSGSNGGGGKGESADQDMKNNGDLGKNSGPIKSLLNNPNLHKVFPGVDYTPWGTQYPLCLKYPPSQNNVTRDLAVLSQLTNTLRLYGTDCNQTEMVLHAIDRLELKDMKLWLGVWIDEKNTTTNERQLDQMYNILKTTKDSSIFKGIVVGNEVLFRGFRSPATLQTLSNYIQSVKNNLTSMGLQLPITTSDLGDAWTADLARITDVIMANIHPFFAGVTAADAAGWTYDFWKNKNDIVTKGMTDKKSIISEVGWPTTGGNSCGEQKCTDSTSGSVAGIPELNTFMDNFVCQALANGTDYFWFEAFDEPWKVQFNEPGKEWEDKWGLMYPDRTLKPGIKIPTCGGKTVS